MEHPRCLDKNAAGEKVIDCRKMQSTCRKLQRSGALQDALAELRSRLHTLASQPDVIPYRTSYFKEDWGFCLSHNQLQDLTAGEYEVCIESTLEPGSLTYGEYFLPGERIDEVLISCHVCHPSLCNDNLSGIALASILAWHLASLSLSYSYRFLFVPGQFARLLGWRGTRKECHAFGTGWSLHASAILASSIISDRVAERRRLITPWNMLCALPKRFSKFATSPYGYDERQYCSPGFDLAVGSLTRTPHGQFPQYHTSADDSNLVTAEALAGSLALYFSVLSILQGNGRYVNLQPKCEPQLAGADFIGR